MLRKRLLLLLALCLLAGSALADPSLSIAELAVLSQSDAVFDSAAYTYRNQPFRAAACGPCALGNAFNAALGVTDKQLAADMTLDLLHMITFGNDHAMMDYKRLTYLTSIQATEYPALARHLNSWGGRIVFTEKSMNGVDISAAFRDSYPFSRLLITPHNQRNEYATVCRAAYSLYHTGHPDASITIAMLSAGTGNTDGAFRTGAGGHYVSLHIPVGEFCEEGTVYLLDSFPRCIKGETPGERYGQAYDFVIITNDSIGLRKFTNHCGVERMTDAILRITPKEPLGPGLLMHPEPIDALNTYERYLSTMDFSSEGYLLVHVPGTPDV